MNIPERAFLFNRQGGSPLSHLLRQKFMSSVTRKTVTLATTFALGALLTACGGESDQQNTAPPAPEVAVITIQPENVPISTQLPGRTTPYLIAEIRPQVGGIIQKRAFIEGTEVQQGELLYQIDPETYAAEVDSARAALARAEASVEAAQVRAERHDELAKIKAVSTQARDDMATAYKQAQAEVASGRAALKHAEINLKYTKVTSPIDGRIGRSTVTPGALVTANQANALATVQQLDPIYVDLTQSGTELRHLRRAAEEGRIQRNTEGQLPVRLLFEDGTEYSHEGLLAFSEVTVDQNTGSVTLRAVFPNPEQRLLPGMYVRAHIDQGISEDAISLPHAAVSRNPRGTPLAMVVNQEDTIEARPLKLQRATGTSWIVTDGLDPGDRVVTEGLQHIAPGDKVRIVDADSPDADAAL